MSLSIFNSVPIEVLCDEKNQPWFKRAHVGSYLELAHINTSLKGLDSSEIRFRSQFKPTYRNTVGWSGPKHQQNKTDVFLSVYGVMHVIVNSHKPKGKELRKWLLLDIIPRGFNKMIEEKQEAIDAEREKVRERDNRIQAIQYDNVALQAQREVYQRQVNDLIANRHVPRSGDIDTILVTIEKNQLHEEGKPAQHPYYMIRCQKKCLNAQIKILRIKYPNMIVKEPVCNDANSIHAWSRFKQDILEKQNYYLNHFSLPEESRELFEGMFGIEI